jgi:hypothetical protein
MVRSLAFATIPVLLAAAPSPAQIDRYLCYATTPSAVAVSFTPVARSLEDAFTPATMFTLRRVGGLCNPADLVGTGPLHPDDHQVAYRIRAAKGSPRFVRRTVSAVDELGVHVLAVQRPDALFVPSTKVLGSGGAPPYVGTAVRHYACYRARQSGFVPPAGSIGVIDQFRIVPYEIRRPVKLCLPADKNGEDPQAPGDPALLLCYRVRGPKLARTPVSTNDQIRPETLDVLRARELCLPAVIAGATTTSSSSSTSIVVTTSTSGPPTTIPPPLPCGDPMSPPQPICWGECAAATPICAATANGCECVAGSTPCGSATFPQCDGACGAGEACVISLSGGCTCQFQGIPCAYAYALTGSCGGVCPPDYTCVGPFFTPDGDGCACVPIGSTCHLTCGADPGAGNCLPGQTCTSGPGGLCLCQ